MFLRGNFALKPLQSGKIMSNNKITQFSYFYWNTNEKKADKKTILFHDETCHDCDIVWCFWKNASWDTIWSSSELHPCLFSCFVCYIWVCKNLSELCCKIFCCSDIFFAPGWTAHQHVQHHLQNQPLAPLLITKSWQGKLLNPRAIRQTLLHFFCQPRLDLETILALLWNIPHLYERFTNHTPHSFVTLSSTTNLRLGLPNKVMSTCELSKLELDETKKEQWARVFLVGFSSSLVRVLWVRLKRNKPGNRVLVSSMGCFIVQLIFGAETRIRCRNTQR